MVKKCIDMFNTIAEDDDRYMNFYIKYSKNIKWGLHTDTNNIDKLLHLVRYFSSQNKEKFTSLTDYVNNMKDDQTENSVVTLHNMGWSIRRISSELRISRERVRRILASNSDKIMLI